MQRIIEEKLLQDIITYLENRPYREVQGAMQLLYNLPVLKPENTEE